MDAKIAFLTSALPKQQNLARSQFGRLNGGGIEYVGEMVCG